MYWMISVGMYSPISLLWQIVYGSDVPSAHVTPRKRGHTFNSSSLYKNNWGRHVSTTAHL